MEAQKEAVEHASQHYTFACEEHNRATDALRMATDTRSEALRELKKEQTKLRHFTKDIANVDAANKVAELFGTARLIFLTIPIPCGSYSTHTADGTAVRFAVKCVIYPLQFDGDNIVGLVAPSAGETCRTIAVSNIRDYTLAKDRSSPSKIQQAAIYELLTSTPICYNSKPIFPCKFKTHIDLDNDYGTILSHTEITRDTKGYISTPVGYICVCVAQRTDAAVPAE
jgi:hypothetical protein